MPKINGNEITPGTVIDHDGGLWPAVKTIAVKPGKGKSHRRAQT
jgi:elongation factor P